MSEIRGNVRVWGLTEAKREYVNLQTTYGEARRLFKSDPYSALSGKGEQRGVVVNHAKMLRREMEGGTFTPTSFHVGVRKNQTKNVKFEEHEGVRYATLTVDMLDTIPLTNGGHRFQALAWIREDAELAIKEAKAVEAKAKTDEEKAEAAKIVAEAEAYLDLVDSQPIEAILLLNGNTQDDFINLQRGKAVDQSHMLSLKIARGVASDKPHLKMASNIAKVLNGLQGSPFYRQIRFDSRGMAPLPLSTLCPKGASDLATSLSGLAKVGLSFGKEKNAEWLAGVIESTYKLLAEKAPTLVEQGKVLTPPPNGTKGSATLLIGIAVAAAYRMCIQNEERMSDRTKAALVEAAKETLDNDVNGNFSGPAKRKLIGAFTVEFFGDLSAVEKHEDVPTGLLKLLSPSAYGVSPLPKAKKETPTPAPTPAETETETVVAAPATQNLDWQDNPEQGQEADADDLPLSAPEEESVEAVNG